YGNRIAGLGKHDLDFIRVRNYCISQDSPCALLLRNWISCLALKTARRTGKCLLVSHFACITRRARDTDSAATVFPAELPPPYTAIASPDASGVPAVNCRVCQSLIGLDGKLHQHVVKCTVCNEATPIKNPPAGKKYVRCPCNCLLICKDTSRRIGCPRPNCRRIINLGPVMPVSEEQPAQPALPVQPEGTRVVCGHCGNTFLWMELRFNTLAKCPHCKKIFRDYRFIPRKPSQNVQGKAPQGSGGQGAFFHLPGARSAAGLLPLVARFLFQLGSTWLLLHRGCSPGNLKYKSDYISMQMLQWTSD
ncbi:type 2 phosphatidylinositol 4,5-bisphosphate 4-phosphatase, partial [Pteropus alecto]|uniref:type 2 phosphatidylinositol 4,5-bisphosphate 4-phosphatase n=1 Tax=Pteropus alecto TaxID=9402 RepID=UPI000D533EE2